MPLDIGLGILAAYLVSKLFGFVWPSLLIFSGIVYALAPDLDYLSRLGQVSKLDHLHRGILHKPFFYLGLSGVIFPFSRPLATLILLCAVFHLLHDSIGIGWGIQWLWPFDEHFYALFYVYSRPDTDLPNKLLYRWTPQQVEKLAKDYGDDAWVKNIYQKLHPIAVMELAGLALGLLLAAFGH